MARTVKVEVDGLDELVDAFLKLGDEAMPKLKRAADAAGAVVLAKAKEKAPVNLGTLQKSLRLKKKTWRKGQLVTYSSVTWGNDVREYAAPLELGHKFYFKDSSGRVIRRGEVAPRPYLRPAADESKDQVFRIITGAMNEAIDAMGGRKDL